jgi:hypothetical protein
VELILLSICGASDVELVVFFALLVSELPEPSVAKATASRTASGTSGPDDDVSEDEESVDAIAPRQTAEHHPRQTELETRQLSDIITQTSCVSDSYYICVI